MAAPSWLDFAKSATDAISGGIDGFLNGTDGGGKANTNTKNETVLRDQNQPDKRVGSNPSSMSTQTMLMIGGGLVLVVVLALVVKK